MTKFFKKVMIDCMKCHPKLSSKFYVFSIKQNLLLVLCHFLGLELQK